MTRLMILIEYMWCRTEIEARTHGEGREVESVGPSRPVVNREYYQTPQEGALFKHYPHEPTL